MNLPTAEEYLQTIDQRQRGGMASLHNYHFLLEEDGKTYLHKKGNNAIVFKTERQSKLYAIRFFFYQDYELFRRYALLQDHLNNKNLGWNMPFCFLDKEYYPFLKMDWVDGPSFSEYLDSIIHDPSAISRLQSKMVNLSRELESNEMAHGDLNLDHIRFAKEGSEYILKLIDYDSLFITAFKGQDSLRIGTAGFQHPMRLASDFSATIDRFSFWVFLTALEAFKINPLLWIESGKNKSDKTEKLIFNFSDLAFPEQSFIFNELKSYNKEALNFYVDKLTGFCNNRSAEAVDAPQLFGEKLITQVKKEKAQNFTTNSSAFGQQSPRPASKISMASQKIEHEVKPAVQRNFSEKKENLFHQPITHKSKRGVVQSETGDKKRRMILIGVAGLIIIVASFYFIKPQNRPVEASSKYSPVINGKTKPATKETIPAPPSVSREASVFTTSNITNSLTQLYQTYNGRKLDLILSNYAENLDDYYDASFIDKDALAGIIKNLFIKPYFYQCAPDWQSMDIENENNNSCKVTITLHEKIKTRKRSKVENYTSQIQYILDKNLKIVSEKRIS